MKGSLRQSMTWLHTWSSITAGWILFAIFFTGTLAFFRSEITHWMQPELHVSVPAENSAEVAYRYLQGKAPGAQEWQISLPGPREETVSASWRNGGEDRQQMRSQRAVLNASTGEELNPRETAGGNFLYRFHFELYGVPRAAGETFVGIVSMMMLIGIVSGVIMHRKIFADFFMFRPKKKLLSWIDGHVLASVLALPFHLMITFSGLLLLGGTLLPWNGSGGGHGGPPGGGGPQGQGGPQRGAPQARAVQHKPAAPVVDNSALLAQVMASASAEWGVPADRITIKNPGTDKATFSVSGPNRVELSAGRGGNSGLVFNSEGEILKVEEASSAPNTSQAIYNYMDMLHQARFADSVTRWLLFFAGILGTLMVGTGSILWVEKRAKKQMGRRGFELVRGTNIGAIAGLMVATGAYFWANRLLPAELATRSDWEIRSFFIVWGLCVVAGLFRRDRKGWLWQTLAAAVLFTFIPLLDVATSPVPVPDTLRIIFDAACLILAALAWYAVSKLKAEPKSERAPSGRKDSPARRRRPAPEAGSTGEQTA